MRGSVVLELAWLLLGVVLMGLALFSRCRRSGSASGRTSTTSPGSRSPQPFVLGGAGVVRSVIESEFDAQRHVDGALEALREIQRGTRAG